MQLSKTYFSNLQDPVHDGGPRVLTVGECDGVVESLQVERNHAHDGQPQQQHVPRLPALQHK